MARHYNMEMMMERDEDTDGVCMTQAYNLSTLETILADRRKRRLLPNSATVAGFGDSRRIGRL